MKIKNKKLLIGSIFIVVCLVIGGCYVAYKKVFYKDPKPNVSSNQTKKSNPETIVKTPEAPKYYAPFTGEEISQEVSKNAAFFAIIENSPDARPQSGLYAADIVYETMAEGGIPRFIALFQKNSPDKIGPIRSARPYFLDITKEYNLPFAHCGYSEEARMQIENQKLMSLNEFTYGSSFYRSTDRKAPHNLYSTADNLRKLASSLNYVKPSNMSLKFDKSYWDNTSFTAANNVLIKLNYSYNTSYTFKDGLYYKSMDGKAAIDKETSTPLTAKNIVIQITDMSIQNDNLHINIRLNGSGEGYLISNGKYLKIKWHKDSTDSQTILKDEAGNQVFLNPGNIWWHIIDKYGTVTFN